MPVPVVCPVYYPTRPNSSLSEVGLALYTRFRERYTTRERRAVEVVPGVHQIPGVRWSRAYLIEDDKLALVDAGPFWTARRIERYIRSIGRHPGDLAYVLMTHSHPDHAGSVRSIVRKTGAHVFAHPHDTAHNPRHGAYLSYMGMIDRLPFLRADVHETVDDGHRLPILGGMRVLHTPGHTPGSVCYLLEDRGVLFSGDTVFSDGNGVSRSVPYPKYNGDDYRRSIQRLASVEFDSLCGGHGSPLVGSASDRLRDLLAVSPDPPTWGRYISSIPRRLYRATQSPRGRASIDRASHDRRADGLKSN